ncbi:hypothetical protein L8C07_01810 [Paenibacillus sp. CMAA1739]|uniref:hypothetical protein n=2 Tax=Paenibacillus ottowii TaxID=2315729 RepID=UPI002730CFAE|nr:MULTISPECIES: hypothetical protein [Paenibacillus]MDP1509209.1 hypothetical protein [Paenibacillus ottowii]MEC4564665.1 hypothetical protein [Paenibacillus sp. CMAA1739]
MFRKRKRQRFHRQPRHQKNELSFSERTTRLALVLTVLTLASGTLGIVGREFFSFFVYSFSSRLYMEAPIRSEHVIVLCIAVYISIIISRVLYYVGLEIYSFNVKSNVKASMQKADQAYHKIFESMSSTLIIMMIVFVLFVIGQFFYFIGHFNIGLIIVFFIIILLSLLLIGIKNNFKFVNFKIINFNCLVLPYAQLFVFLIIFLVYLMFALAIMQPGQPIDIKIDESKIIINSKNYAPINTTIIFAGIDNNETSITREIHLKESDFKVSYQAVIEERDNKDNFLYHWTKFSPNNNKSFKMNNTVYNYHYKLDYKKYIKEGENYVRIVFVTRGLSSSNNTEIATPITYKDKKYDIQQTEFHIK